jgi:N-acetyl-D-muramate 6-phosphate phosphatase
MAELILPRPAAVLFDLDGTVIDSAPDLAGTANDMRRARGLETAPFESLRPWVGAGARGMIGAAFAVAPNDAGFDDLKDEFLERYALRLLTDTRVFEAMEAVLDAIQSRGIPWGIVTNKHERFTLPIARGLGLDRRSAVVICGDTTPHAKPHPAPLLEAARRLGVEAARCVYIGDDRHDREAARAARMRGGVARWGYIDPADDVDAWGGDAVLEQPHEILNWLSLA